MAVKNSEKVGAFPVDIELKYIGIFHSFSPTSHVSHCSVEVFEFLGMGLLFEIGLSPQLLISFDWHDLFDTSFFAI